MGVELKAEQKTSIDNAHKIPEMGFFNDKFRDVIKGSTFDHLSPGYILGNINNHFEIDDSLFGSMLSKRFDSFNQSINYIECHDNQTLFDKLSYFDESLETNLKRLKLANALTVLSFGVPFIHMGQEIGLSKQLLDNTYNIKKINNMDWKLVEERKTLVNFFSDLVKLRKSLKYSEIETIDQLVDNTSIEHLDNGLTILKTINKNLLIDDKYAVIIINPTENNISFELDDYYALYFSSSGIVDKTNHIKYFISPGLSIDILVK